MKKATTIDEQIEKFRSRYMNVEDEAKAREVLLDIGYYRLGFYCCPFERPRQPKEERTHIYIDGTRLRNAIDLYYFDCGLRDLLSTALHRVEVNFRTQVCYYASNAFKESPTWFMDAKYVLTAYAGAFNKKVYGQANIKNSKWIKKHHRKYNNDKYAPAWKTIECMTFGQVLNLFRAIRNQKVQVQIASTYGIDDIEILINYITAVKDLRNLCAHNAVLFDAHLSQRIRKGPVANIRNKENHHIIGAIKVLIYLLNTISTNRAEDLKRAICHHIQKHRSICPRLDIFAEDLVL